MSDTGPYIVVPKSAQAAASLTAFLEAVETRFKGVVTVRRVVGDTSNPRRLVVEAPSDAIGELKAQFDQTLHIEPDAALKPL